MSLTGRLFVFNDQITMPEGQPIVVQNATPQDIITLPLVSGSSEYPAIGVFPAGTLGQEAGLILGGLTGMKTLWQGGVWAGDEYKTIQFVGEPTTFQPSEEAFMTWLLANATEGRGMGELSEFEDPDGNAYYYKDAKAREDIADLKDNLYQSHNHFPPVGKVGKWYIASNENVAYRWAPDAYEYVRMGYYPVFTGAQSGDAGTEGLVPAPTANDTNLYLKGNGTWSLLPVETLYYLTSTWNDFVSAFNRNATVFCRVGDQITPMYSARPTEVLFIGYEYDSNNSVYEITIYKLNSNNVWSSHTYQTPFIPFVTSADDGKILQVVNGEWAAVTIPSANGVSF